MDQVLLASATVLSAAEEHGEELVWGFTPGVYGIVAGILFLLMFIITISFSGRGLDRSSTAHLSSDEQQALADYKAKHHR